MVTTEKPKNQYVEVPTTDNEKKNLDKPPDFGYGVRHIQLVIFFICVATSFIARSHLSVTIVAMTSQNNVSNHLVDNSTVKSDILASSNDSTALTDFTSNSLVINSDVIMSSNESIGLEDPDRPVYTTYDWSKPIQETVLSSFFLGYCLGTFPAALVCQRWGGKIPLQVSLLVNGAVSLLTPFLTLWGGWKAVSACRVIQGLAQAGTYPGLQTLLARWAPINERATMSSYVYTGSTIGNIIGFQVSGVLAEAWGWAVNFWAVGAVCLLCFVFITVFGSATPQAHSTISEEEKRYILGHNDNEPIVPMRRAAPWKAILSSPRVWANFITHVGSGTSFIFLMTQIPSFTHYILGVNVKSSGLLSSLPYLASFFASCGFGLLSDYLTNRNLISNKTARRLFNSISQLGVVAALVGASFANTTVAAVTCFVFAVSCHTAVHAGWMLNHIDLTPQFGGTLMACGNTLMNVVVLVMPVIVSNVVVDVRNAFQWRIMLWLVAGLCFVTNIVFVLFVSVEVQPWNDAGVDDDAANENGSLKITTEKEEKTIKDFQ